MNGPEDGFPGPLQAVVLVALLFVAELLAGLALRALDAPLGLRLAEGELVALATVLGNGLVFSTVMHRLELSWGGLWHGSPVGAGRLMAFVGLPVMGLVPGLVLVNSVMGALLVAAFPLSERELALFRQMAEPTVATTLLSCALAPMLEEMLFRGVILRGFLQRFPPRPAILLSATLFGVAHLNLYQFVAATVLGIVLGWLYERTRSLWPGVLLHAAYNTALLLLDRAQDGPDTPAAAGPEVLGAGLAAAGLAWLAARRLRRLLG